MKDSRSVSGKTMNTANEKIQTEVLVIGGGQAGILAAIECADAEKKVILVTKGPFGRDGASTWLAGWGNQMALYAPDSPEIHAADTFRAGMFINNQRLVHNLTKELPSVFEKLRKWKIRYKIIKDKVVQVEFPDGATYPRILSLAREGVMGGPEYRRVLPNQVKKRHCLPCQFLATEEMTIEPHPSFTIIKDLVCDWDQIDDNANFLGEVAKPYPTIFVDPDKCVHCGDCVLMCSVGVYEMVDKKAAVVHNERCLGRSYQMCSDACWKTAISIKE